MFIALLVVAAAVRCSTLSSRLALNISELLTSVRPVLLGTTACLLVVLLSGCGDKGVYHLSGTVSFNGQPIPEGYIVFEPDGSKGNTGQPGRSTIRNGEYDTSGEDGMAVVGGPHVIRVVAHKAAFNPDVAVGGGEVVMPDLLFPPYTFHQDLPAENGEVNFDIPPEAANKK